MQGIKRDVISAALIIILNNGNRHAGGSRMVEEVPVCRDCHIDLLQVVTVVLFILLQYTKHDS